MSLRLLEYSMSGFNNNEYVEELQGFYDEWWASIDEIFPKLAKDNRSAFYSYLFPKTDDLA